MIIKTLCFYRSTSSGCKHLIAQPGAWASPSWTAISYRDIQHLGSKQNNQPNPPPLYWGDRLVPIPSAVVKKIQSLEFVDFSELMTDNWELLRRADQTATDGKTSSKAPLRQVTSITSWAQCFMVNAAILLSKFPHKVVEVMAYGKMIIREAGRHGGEGWKVYDTLFRQMVAADKTTPRSKLNSTLYATTFLSMCDPHGQGAQCLIYMESDHREVDCALTSDHTKGSSAVTKETPPHQGNCSWQNIHVVAQPNFAGLLTLPHAQAPRNVSTGIPASVVVKALIEYPSVRSPHHKEMMIIPQCLRVLGHQSHL